MSNTVHIEATLTHFQYGVLMQALEETAAQGGQVGDAARLVQGKIAEASKVVGGGRYPQAGADVPGHKRGCNGNIVVFHNHYSTCLCGERQSAM